MPLSRLNTALTPRDSCVSDVRANKIVLMWTPVDLTVELVACSVNLHAKFNASLLKMYILGLCIGCPSFSKTQTYQGSFRKCGTGG